MPAWGPILAATDFSAAARHAADRAGRLAQESGAALSLLHVLPGNALQELRQWLGVGSAAEQQLQARSEKRLYSIMLSAYSEYMSHPVEERNLVTKVSAVLSKSGELTAAQNQCDAEFAQIMAAMRKTLRENGRDESIADEAEKTYKQKKNALIKELTSQAYSGGDGSGQSGKWLAEHADGNIVD